MNRKTKAPSRTEHYVVVLCGILFAILYWILDSAVHAYLLHEGSFAGQIFNPPDTNQIAVRSAIALMFIVMSLYAQIVIDKHRNAEETARENEEKYRALFESSPEAILLIGVDGTILDCNTATIKLSNLSREEIIGKPALSVGGIYEEDIPQFLDLFSRLARGEEIEPLEVRIFGLQHETRWNELFPSLLTRDDEVQAIQIILRDVTERKQAEEALRESEEKYSTLVEQASDAVIIIQDGVCRFVNKAMAEISGYPIEEIVGMPFLTIVAPDLRDTIAQTYGWSLTGNEYSALYELKIQCKNGDVKNLEIAAGVTQYNGKPADMAIARDITERKRIEQMKTDFVALVSHQLKTPVAIVKGYVDNMLLGLAGKLTSKQREYLNDMRDISTKNYHLVSDLLNVSRIERGVISVDISSFSLTEIIELAVSDYRSIIKHKGLSLNIEHSTDEIMVSADRDKMVEALSNVVNNAIKFTDQGMISVSARTSNGFGVVEIADTGKGMSPELMSRLFTKDQVLSGSPTPEGSSGLGLYIAKEFMQLQHGDISATTSEGSGSSFVFHVPLADQTN